MDPISAIASVVGVIGFTASCARNVLALVSEIRDAPEEISDLATDLQNLALVLQSAQGLCSKHGLQPEDAPIVTTLMSCLETCQDVMDAIKTQLRGFLGMSSGRRSPLRAIGWTLRKGEIRALRARLSDAKASINMAVTVLNGHLTKKAQDDIRKDMAEDYERLLAEFQNADRARHIRTRLEDDLTSVSGTTAAQTLSVSGETDTDFPMRKFFQSYEHTDHLEPPAVDGGGVGLETPPTTEMDYEEPRDPLTLIQASRSGDYQMVRHCLMLGQSPDQRAPDGRTALHFAAIANDSEMATILTENGADADAKDNSRLTPFNVAVAMRSIETATVLVKKGCDLDDLEGGLFEMLRDAKSAVRVQRLLKVLVDRIKERKDAGCEKYLLLEAINRNETAGLQALLEAGFSTEVSRKGISALHQAILQERKDAVKLLLKHGANPNEILRKETEDLLDRTVPWQRALVGSIEAGITPLGTAGRIMEDIDTVRLLLDAGADPNFEIPDGGVVLQALCAIMYLPIAKLLVDRGAQPNHLDGWRLGPMYWAATCGNLELLQLLLEKGGDVNLQASPNWSMHTPLHGAVFNHCPEVTEVLVKAGADRNAKDSHGRRPIDLHNCADPDCAIPKVLKDPKG